MPGLPESCAVAVVGGGPAGLAAATALAEMGVGPVVVLEREAAAGGIPRHCGHPPFGMREFRRVLRGPDYATRLVAAAERAGVRLAGGMTVTALRPGPLLELASDAGTQRLAARRVVLATGVREASRAARLIGGTKPNGVLATGALQGLVYLNGEVPFQRPVILGTELVSFSAILTCRHAGIRPVAMVEPGDRPVAFAAAAALPRALGIPVHYRTDVVEVLGEAAVTGLRLAGGGRDWVVEADGLVVTGRFVPEAALLRAGHLALDPRTGGPVVDQFGRCSDPDYFAAGNLLRPVETAGWSWAEGRACAEAVRQSLAGGLPDPEEAVPIGFDAAALRYVMPQRLVPDAPATLQLRVDRPVAGMLRLRGTDGTWAERRIATRPERRVLLHVPHPPRGKATLELAVRR